MVTNPVTKTLKQNNTTSVVHIYIIDKKMKEQKKVFQNKLNHIYCQLVSVNGVPCVFVVYFRSSGTFKVCKLP